MVENSKQPARVLPGIYTIPVTALDGAQETLERFRGKVLLIVNVASECGFTPQYRGLEALYRRHREQGFEVLGFPCNQFGRQEPGDAAQIRSFCSTRYEVTFALFSKIEVNGPNAHPLYKRLKAERPGVLGSEAIKWNFTKFLVGRKGNVLKRFAPATKPEALEEDIVAACRA